MTVGMNHLLTTRAAPLVTGLLLLLLSGVSPARALDPGPGSVVISPDSDRLYVANSVSNTVSVIDIATLQVVATVVLGGRESLLHGMAITSDGSRLYVAPSYSNQVDVVDTAANQVIRGIGVVGISKGVVVTPDGGHAYVASADGTVSVIDNSSGNITASITVETGLSGIAISPNGKQVYTVDQSGTLSLIDTDSNRVTGTVVLDSGARAVVVSPNGTRVYVPTGDNEGTSYAIWTIDPAAKRVMSQVNVPAGHRGTVPDGAAISPDGKRLYVVDLNGDQLTVIDTTAGQMAASLKVGTFPWGVAASSDGNRVYVIHKTSWMVDVIDAHTLQIVGTIKLGPPPSGTNSI